MKLFVAPAAKLGALAIYFGGNKARAIGLVSIVLAINMILGLGRDSLLAASYGAGEELDALLLGLNTVKTFGVRIAMATVGAMVPVMVPFIVKGEIVALTRLVRRWLITISVFMVFVTIMAVCFASNLAKLLAPGFSLEGIELLTWVIVGLLPLLFVFAFAGLSKAIGDSYDSPVIYPLLLIKITIGLIVGVLLFGQQLGVMAAVIGTVGGGVVGLFVQWYLIRRKTSFRIHIQKTPHAFLPLSMPYMAFAVLFSSSIIVQFQGLVERAAVSYLPPGSMSALGLALSVLAIPSALLLPAVSSVLLPYLVRQNIQTGISVKLPYKALILAVAIILLGQVLIWISSNFVVNLLFLRGEFTHEAAVLTADTLRWMSLGTGLFIFSSILRQVVIANKLVWHDFAISLLILLIEIPLLTFLVPIWGLRGLAVIGIIAMSLNTFLYFLSIKYASCPAKLETVK